jgi:hypothetical protein
MACIVWMRFDIILKRDNMVNLSSVTDFDTTVLALATSSLSDSPLNFLGDFCIIVVSYPFLALVSAP